MPWSDYFDLVLHDPTLGDANPSAQVEWVTGEAWPDIRPRAERWVVSAPAYLD